MSGSPDPKPGHRREVIDRAAGRRHLLAHRECVACSGSTVTLPGANAHHVLERDDGGDDVPENFVTLCGTGTSLCHGAYHGNPYTVEVPDPFLVPGDEPRMAIVRRDRLWVAWRIGDHIERFQPETIDYIVEKLGAVAGRHYLTRYGIILDRTIAGDIVCP